jgi:hypothetical protein
MQSIDNYSFREIIYRELKDLISISHIITGMASSGINRKILGRVFLEASKNEEILDSYGANQNKTWFPLRKNVAIIKSFSQVAYDLLHLREAVPFYNLLQVEGDFSGETDKTIKKFLTCFYKNTEIFLALIKEMGLTGDLVSADHYEFEERPVQARLVNDIKGKDYNTREVTIYLATAFLNLAEEGSVLKTYKKTKKADYCTCFPQVINEEKLRLLTDKFHNLQALYDTYLLRSSLVLKDSNLPVMRGQISVVYHLLDMATILSHYYERHCIKKIGEKLKTPITNVMLLSMIMEYFIAYADKFIVSAQNLCRDVLKNYAIEGLIEVPIPNYRGFHVRPSTLIAKIVIHYGSDVQMQLGDKVYNASMPLELFRANEELNLTKRNKIIEEIIKHALISSNKEVSTDSVLLKKKLRMIFLDLLERQKLVLYDNDYTFKDITPHDNETLLEFSKRAITLYLALGKIDIVSNAKVIFKGDVRVLEDIKVLANHGYGEDKYGNNIVLPSELSYLKR